MQRKMANHHFPRWKYALIIIAMIFGLIYALPNIYGEDPAVQISASRTAEVSGSIAQAVKVLLEQHEIGYKSLVLDDDQALIRFFNTDDQLLARDLIKKRLNEKYIVALNMAPATPTWLQQFNALPMRLGLDLRGGVHFLLSVDVDSVIKRRLQGQVKLVSDALRKDKIRYKKVKQIKGNSIMVAFRNAADLDNGYRLLRSQYPEMRFNKKETEDSFLLLGDMTEDALHQYRRQIVEQTMSVLRNRVNELGIAEPIVQQQGKDRIAVDLPGVQDSTQAKQILGSTATIEFHLVDDEHDVRTALAGQVPFGSRVYRYENGVPVLLRNSVVLEGSSITSAMSSMGQDGRPAVSITASGNDVSYFSRVTGENVGKQLAIVFVENKLKKETINGAEVEIFQKQEHVISAPVIQVRLGGNFQITGIQTHKEANNLALLLRAGALPANINIVEESTVGPSLGRDNIAKGIVSIQVGFLLVVAFMLVYYRVFGLIANLALGLNLVLLVAVLSMLGATLTLPGIAGIVLTVGMAVDANVLVFERIREELRNGMSSLASIQAGYERALVTIIDANITTLIVAFVLVAVGSGAVKGFAVTLIIGLVTSMFTAVTFTRGLVHLIYGNNSTKKLSIGI